MAQALGTSGVLQVIPPAALEQQLDQQAKDKADAAQAAQPQQDVSPLAGFIKGQFEIFRNHRNTQAGWSNRLIEALRIFNGQYDPNKLREIKRFGGSEIYVRMIAQKCRAASSLLRDIYLGQDRPWALKPPASPEVPENITGRIDQLMQIEEKMMAQAGSQVDPTQVMDRKRQLLENASDAAKQKAVKQARDSEDKIETLIRDGGFYHALAEFLVDLPIFPFACIKGPVVKIVPEVVWPPGGGMPTVKQVPKLTWNRVSPFDLWWTPGVADIENASTIEKLRLTRGELNDLLDLPGYNTDEIRMVLDEYGRGGLYDNWDTTDAERAVLESRENPAWNRSRMISMMEFNGNVQGRELQDYGLAVPEELRDYNVQVWVIGSHVIKAHLSPSPRQRHPYFITSFEKVPGTPVGNGLTDLLMDVQEATNGTARALLNNLAMSSGPQTVVNDDRLAPEENGEDIYPWKRWHTRNDPVGNNTQEPIKFFQPQSNAQELITVFKEFLEIADDVSAIPKYIGGQASSGGAGRTASGLAMLMGNASKILQSVSANIDRDVMEPALQQLFELILLTDSSGLLTGEESVSVQGVNVAVQRETQRQRQIEFLQATNNPTDMKIVGLKGRAAVLRAVGRDIGVDSDQVIPDEEQLEQMQKRDEQQAQGQPIQEAVAKGVAQGVQQGVSLITKEITAGELAQHGAMPMPEGMPAHISNLPPQGNGAQKKGPTSSSPAINMNDPTHEAARVSQGTQKGRIAGRGMGPQTAVVGNQPGKGALPVKGGVG